MNTIHISEILFDLSRVGQGNEMIILEVEEVDYSENCVRCKDNYLDFYPDHNGMFITP